MSDAQASAGDENRLWSAWRTSGDLAAREKLVLMHLPFARGVAIRLYRQRGALKVEFDEYYQLACVGMLEAMARYEEDRGASFRTYAMRRIEGSILNGLEKLSEVSEQISLRRRLERERLASLKGETGVGSRGTDTLKYLSEIAVGLAIGYMLEETAMYIADENSGRDTAYAGEAWRQTKLRVTRAVEMLPERERRVVVLHYFHALAFDQIAAAFGLSKGRISQIHKAAIVNLKTTLGTVDQFLLIR